ncbi:hypothetical protein O1M63_38955 [Streptomyces mirabilis]|nr:hypothetical protein [Streptomyces mirabilis]
MGPARVGAAPAPGREGARALRRPALAGGAATEEYCYPLYSCLITGNGRVPSAATAALPFVVALAADPEAGARVDLVGLLVAFAHATRTARPDLVDAGGPRRGDVTGARSWHCSRTRTPMCGGGHSLADCVVPLLERWRAETDPAVRLPVLLRLAGWPPRRHKRMPGRSRRCGRSSTASCVTASPS